MTDQNSSKSAHFFSLPPIGVGLGALLSLVISLIMSPPSSWILVFALVVAVILAGAFYVRLGSAANAPRAGVAVALLGVAPASTTPLQLTLVWVFGVFCSQLIMHRRFPHVLYTTGLATVAGGLAVVLQVWFLNLGVWPLLSILAGTVFFYAASIASESIRRRLHDDPGYAFTLRTLDPWRISLLVLITTATSFSMFCFDSPLLAFLQHTTGSDRSPFILVITGIVFYMIAQKMRLREVTDQLRDVASTAVDLPHQTGDDFARTLTTRAGNIVLASDISLRPEPAHRHEISAPVILREGEQEHLVASRKIGGEPFSQEDRRAIDVLAHAATQAAAMRIQLEDLERRANTDTLTGLPNYGAFQLALSEANTHREYHEGIALLFIDLDNFKQLNDTHGHRAGDLLLQAVAERLQLAAGGGNHVSRVGGDEFVIILVGLDSLEQAKETAEYIVDQVSQPLTIEGHDRRPIVSAGLAFSSHRELDARTLVEDADRTMLHVKRSRKSQGASTSSLSVSSHRSTRTNDIVGRAIREHRLTIAFQPIVNIATGRIWAFEALVRYIDPELGPISPPSLVARAKSLGLLNELTQQVITKALSAAEAFRAVDPSVSCMTVNLELGQITDAQLGPFIRLAAAAHPNISLCVELNERSLHSATNSLRDDAEELQAAGILVALDDYGSNDSLVGALVHFPFDVLKLDKSLIDNLDDQRQRELISALQTYGDTLNFTTVVEGVENQGMVDTLVSLGVKSAQGYHFGRPIMEQQVIERLRKDLAKHPKETPLPQEPETR